MSAVRTATGTIKVEAMWDGDEWMVVQRQGGERLKATDFPPNVTRLMARAKADPSLAEGPLWPTCPKCRREVHMVGDVQPDAHTCCTCQDRGFVAGPWVPVPSLGQLTRGTIPCDRCAPALDLVSELRRRGFPEEALGADISAIETGKPGGVTALQLWASLWPECEQNVMLVGPAGTGKTYAAVALSKALLATKGALPWFTTAAGLLQRLRATVRDDATEHEGQILGGLQRVPVLVLDDIGREKLTDFAAERLFGLINHRWSNKLTTIATANMDTYMALPEAWRSRLSSGVLVTFEGLADKRLKRDKPRRML